MTPTGDHPVRSGPQPAWEQQALVPEEAYGLDGTPGPLEGLEDQPDGLLHLSVGIKADRSVASVNEADRLGLSRVRRAAPC